MLRPRDGASVLCKFSQSKCTSTFHKTFPCGNYQGTRTGRLGTSFCASLGSRNADRHVTRTILHEHLQGKGRTPRPRTSLFEQGIFYDPPSIPTAEEVPRWHWAQKRFPTGRLHKKTTEELQVEKTRAASGPAATGVAAGLRFLCSGLYLAWAVGWRQTEVSNPDIVLSEAATSKCTCTFHKNYFVPKFAIIWPDTDDSTTTDRWALTLTVRTLQCGHIVQGMIRWWLSPHAIGKVQRSQTIILLCPTVTSSK